MTNRSSKHLLPYAALSLALVVTSIGWWRSEQGRRSAVDRAAQLEAAANRGGGPASPSSTTPSSTETGNPQNPDSPAPSAASGANNNPKSSRDPRYLKGGGPGAGDNAAESAATIEDLRQRIQELARELSGAREEVARAEARSTADATEVKTLQSQLAELRETNAQTRRLLDAAEAEWKVKSDRLAKAEAAEKSALERASKAESAAARSASQSRELEDLIRRRESLAASLHRRYRDVTDLYRNFTLNVQTRDTQSPGLQAGDLSRIQTAVQQAEEDLRQMQSLNLRITQLSRGAAPATPPK